MNGNNMVFPVLDRDATPNGTEQLGLTKREYFAALAMQGYCSRPQSVSLQGPLHIAEEALHTADALLAALDKVPVAGPSR